jgi:hypothetical protein
MRYVVANFESVTESANQLEDTHPTIYSRYDELFNLVFLQLRNKIYYISSRLCLFVSPQSKLPLPSPTAGFISGYMLCLAFH